MGISEPGGAIMRHDSTGRVDANPKWIRGYRDGKLIVDSRSTRLVWEHRYYPFWYIPTADIADETVIAAGRQDPEGRAELESCVRLEWSAMDSWFEEDVEVFVHPRSPEIRVDVLPTSRHIKISLDGVTLAESDRARILYETGLLPRYYLPKTDVRLDLLTPTDLQTVCPYKGWASYWNVTVGDTIHSDLVWGYATTLPESRDIAGLLCFYNEKVDIEVDGVLT
ncbi:MAG: hypothetical protein ACI8Y4_004498 [Candidatus Poriferisodalaceae bacterium]|jgi:uncharacterized protein (DUF427 family)